MQRKTLFFLGCEIGGFLLLLISLHAPTGAVLSPMANNFTMFAHLVAGLASIILMAAGVLALYFSRLAEAVEPPSTGRA